MLSQTAEQDAYDFFTSELDGDIFDHISFPHHTNETRDEGPPPTIDTQAEDDQPHDARPGESEMDEGDSSALLEQQVSCLASSRIQPLILILYLEEVYMHGETNCNFT